MNINAEEYTTEDLVDEYHYRFDMGQPEDAPRWWAAIISRVGSIDEALRLIRRDADLD